MFKDAKELWSAWVKFPKSDDKEIKFCYAPMEIARRYETTLEMKYSHFTSSSYSTKYFEEYMLEREYRITEELKMFYSASKEKCIEWLNNERDTAVERCRRDLERLERAEIREKPES